MNVNDLKDSIQRAIDYADRFSPRGEFGDEVHTRSFVICLSTNLETIDARLAAAVWRMVDVAPTVPA